MMIDRARASGWRPLLGAAIALLVAACSGGVGALPDPEAVPAYQVERLPVTTRIDATQTLAAAVDSYRDGYQSLSRATVNGVEAFSVSSRTVAGNTEMSISSGDGEIEYLIVGESQWARTPGEPWELVADSAPPSPSLHLLALPLEVAIVSIEGGQIFLTGLYRAEAFELPPGELKIDLEVTDGALSRARYTTTKNGVTAGVTTEFAALQDRTAITAPGSDA